MRKIAMSFISRKIKSFSAVIAASLTLGIAHSAASLTLSQQPLFLKQGTDPNIMFVLDDSGSMQFEVTPSEVANYFNKLDRVVYVFPNTETNSSSVKFVPCPYADGNTSSCDYWANGDQAIPRFEADNKWAAYFRSAYNNKTYYNPEIRYEPWSKEDGSLWPAANPEAAYHNPANTSKGWRNLTVDNYQRAKCWLWDSANKNSHKSDACGNGYLYFYPATYFQYSGNGSLFDSSNYTRKEIRSGLTFPRSEDRTDCKLSTTSCSYEEEIQNFANWYSYYRSRVLLSRAGIGKAFSSQTEGLRVGFGTLNKGTSNVDQVSTGTIISGVRAFSGDDREDFFENLYGVDIPQAGTPLLSALKRVGDYYSRTDRNGPWAGEPGTNDSSAQVACRASYTILMTDGYGNDYSSISSFGNVDGNDGNPFQDSRSNTLADIARYYWENDLHGSLDNKVDSGEADPADWQHMVTFGVGLGVTGSVDSDTAFNAIESGAAISWPNPNNSDAAKLDDLLHAGVNSRGGFYNAANATVFASQLSDLLTRINEREASSSSVAANSTRLSTDSAIFQAIFNSGDWSGEIKSIRLESDGTLSDTTLWSTSTAGKIPTNNRDIITFDGSDTVNFSWSNLTSSQKTALISTDDEDLAKQRLNWVRGEDVDGLRDRAVLLGDVVNASPVLASNKDQKFKTLPDNLGGNSYQDYLEGRKNNRSEILYVSSNDGMLHAFDSSDGSEKFAYIPSAIYSKLKNVAALDYGTEDNPHQYLVDGPLFVSDAYFAKNKSGSPKWMNVLVGTYGAGAKGLFALDITDPENPDILFEIDGSNPDIGNILGRPIIAPTEDGWKVIFGNGYNSANDKAKLLVIDLADPADIQVIATNTNTDNGLAGPSLLIDSNRVVHAAYAGDLMGNMWKFDISGSKWQLAFSGNAPLFTARDPNGKVQPITSTPVLGSNAEVDGAIMVYFGTGKYVSQTDQTAGSIIHSFYGIVDKGVVLSGTDRSDLMQKSIVETGNSRSVTNDGDTSWWPTKSGWYLDFNSTGSSISGERVISKPLLINDRLIFPTLIPSDDPCVAGASGWIMELVALGDPRFAGESIIGGSKKVDEAIIGFSDVIIAGRKIIAPYIDVGGNAGTTGGFRIGGIERISWRRIR
ncbi:pilus assembly protein [Microbulbifer sp. JMSA002]|uniref:pilus assembly protein n=1 Tax=Microbulbifer sp. JMSA002 TaxID=3243368 RepID=UPI00403A7B9C